MCAGCRKKGTKKITVNSILVMKTDIILAGVGGQGILSIAAVIASAALDNGLYIKQAEVHGMSQRGGDVQSHLRISDSPVSSDLIPAGQADVILSVEPMEALRYIPFLHNEGWIVTNETPFINIGNYPDIDKIISELKARPRVITLNAETLAKDSCGSERASNMVMLGAAIPYLKLSEKLLESAVIRVFGRKGQDVVNSNIAALRAGLSVSGAK